MPYWYSIFVSMLLEDALKGSYLLSLCEIDFIMNKIYLWFGCLYIVMVNLGGHGLSWMSLSVHKQLMLSLDQLHLNRKRPSKVKAFV